MINLPTELGAVPRDGTHEKEKDKDREKSNLQKQSSTLNNQVKDKRVCHVGFQTPTVPLCKHLIQGLFDTFEKFIGKTSDKQTKI
jgi:hypothetical protein